MNQVSPILIDACGIKKYFKVSGNFMSRSKKLVHAVDGVDLQIRRAETIGLVGESGCGKSTLGRALLRLIEPNEGTICYEGQDISKYTERAMRPLRQKMQLIFQDPYASLNPRMTIMDTLRAPLDNYDLGGKAEKMDRIRQIVQQVGLDEDWLYRYPHEFSGGQRQRVVIARALIMRPEFVVCDEAVSALDVSVRSQVLNLMQDLQQHMKLTYLFISHDLSVIKHMSDRIVVMYLGKVVESAPKDALMRSARHPYTQALISAIPQPSLAHKEKRTVLKGDIPSPINPPTGCRFHTRCPVKMDVCVQAEPALRMVGADHQLACHLCTQ